MSHSPDQYTGGASMFPESTSQFEREPLPHGRGSDQCAVPSAMAWLARQLGVSRPTVLRWRDRFAASGIPGILKDAPRPGRRKAIIPEVVKRVVEATMHTTPRDATHWSVRSMAQAQGLSRMAVQRIWKQHRLQPHRVENFKFSKDPQFVEKLRDVVGLYLNLHFVPAGSSWLNMVERWFGEITRKRIRRGTFQSVPQLIAAITDYLQHYNATPVPFVWTKDADMIIAKSNRCKEALGTAH